MNENDKIFEKRIKRLTWQEVLNHLNRETPIVNHDRPDEHKCNSRVEVEFVDLKIDTRLGAQIDPSEVQIDIKASGHGKFSWKSVQFLISFLPKLTAKKLLNGRKIFRVQDFTPHFSHRR